MNPTILFTLIVAGALMTGCATRDEAGVPKTRFLTTGVTRDLDSDEDAGNESYQSRSTGPTDHYRTQSDLTMIHRLRRAIDRDDALAPLANHVSLSITDGNVTLRGLVPTEGDKTLFGLKAQKVAGRDNVSNQIAVRGD